MTKKQTGKSPLGKWGSGSRVFLILLIVAFFIAGFGMDFEEVRRGSLWGLTGWHFISVCVGFGIGVMVTDNE